METTQVVNGQPAIVTPIVQSSYTLGKVDGIKILRGLGVALAGAGLTYLSGVIAHMSFGQYTPIVYVFWSTLTNTAIKFLDGVSA